ncbi:hypothetical protein PVAND_001828 [Polypedilum vanderplanki]|uniref:Uncharacterized protein n=1 Tax=Polypedilum vanderplanki TaxID=319348 RepID=A0A9J6BPK8_POLVA|nr:hypothetical protein PVAND_001828 [Polypedilum vanderplanki]
MHRIFGARKKERQRVDNDRKWWQFLKKSRVKPIRALNIQHHVNFNEEYCSNNNNNSQYYEMEKYMDRDNNHYRRRQYDDNFIMQHENSSYHNELRGESSRDSLESSEISSDTFSNNYRQYPNNTFNHITQHIQNNNNKITIIIKHNDGPNIKQQVAPQIIYIQPVASSQPNLRTTNNSNLHTDTDVYNSLDDLESDELYQFYNESAIDVPDDFKGNSYLVFNMNDTQNKKFRRRICTPTRNLLTLPAIDEQKFPGISKRINKIEEQKKKSRSIQNKPQESVVKNTQRTSVVSDLVPPVKPKRTSINQRATLPPDTSKLKTFADHKKLLNDYYNWNVVFPPTTIHENSILYRDAAQKESYRDGLRRMSMKVMTMGGGQLGSDFGGSNKDLSPRKMKNKSLLYSEKLTKSELSLNQIKHNEINSNNNRGSSSLLNMIGMPFNWKSRMLMSKSNDTVTKKKSSNVFTNFLKRKRNGIGYVCNERKFFCDFGVVSTKENFKMNSEDAMWKNIWETLQEDKMKPASQREIK